MSGRPSWNLSPCGTVAAYRRHYRKGQKPCQQCLDAHNLAGRVRNAAAERTVHRDEAGRFITGKAS